MCFSKLFSKRKSIDTDQRVKTIDAAQTSSPRITETIRDKSWDLCFLRDLFVIAFANDGPRFSPITNEIIDIFIEMNKIDPKKKEDALSIAPEEIEDIYPTEYEEKTTYIHRLLYLWKHSGNRSKNESLQYIKEVSKKMNISKEDFVMEYDIVNDSDLSMWDN